MLRPTPNLFVIALLTTLLTTSTAVRADGNPSWTHSAEDDRIGRIYYYERSNVDGSMDERISVYRKSATEIEVYKENGFCQRAALVTASLELDTLSASRITGGSLLPDAAHTDFAFIEASPDRRRLSMLVQLPDMEIRNEAEVHSMPWVLYDFDLASLTVALPHVDRREDGFSFGMAMLWADPEAADPFFWLGELEASYQGAVDRLGVTAEHYRLTGSALQVEMSTGPEGELWLDHQDGHIVDVMLPLPNHPGYRDFRLKLLQISDGGEPEWTALLKRHYQDCP